MSVAGDTTAIASLKDTLPDDTTPDGHSTYTQHVEPAKADLTKTHQDSADTIPTTTKPMTDVSAGDRPHDAPAEALETKGSADTLVDLMVRVVHWELNRLQD